MKSKEITLTLDGKQDIRTCKVHRLFDLSERQKASRIAINSKSLIVEGLQKRAADVTERRDKTVNFEE